MQWVLPFTSFLLFLFSLPSPFSFLIRKAVFSKCTGICFYTIYTGKWERLGGEVAFSHGSGELGQGYVTVMHYEKSEK